MILIKELISTIYPNKCIGCGEIIDEIESLLCDFCLKNIERNNVLDLCTTCGYENKNCVCKYNIYRFNKLLSVFKNEGIAQKIYYNYKFNKRQHYAKYFADEMTLFIKQFYSDIKFDYVCSVPNSKKFLIRQSYDHSRFLAEHIAQNLNIPYLKNILFCDKVSKKQHKSSIKERLINVDEKYKYNFNIDGKTVLLVDDIRTTGATLDECSKTLLYAGADNVYCVVALATSLESKD